jgi:translation initiation factor 2 alpha subunit (eIF-2alpha)
VSPEDIIKCEERYTKSKTVASIMRHVASKVAGGHVAADDEGDLKEEVEEPVSAGGGTEEERLEQLHEAIAWPLAKKYGHTYDAFKLALTYVSLRRPFPPPSTHLIVGKRTMCLTDYQYRQRHCNRFWAPSHVD